MFRSTSSSFRFLHFLHNLAFITVLLAGVGVGLAHYAGQSLVLDPQRGLIISDERAPAPERARRGAPAAFSRSGPGSAFRHR